MGAELRRLLEELSTAFTAVHVKPPRITAPPSGRMRTGTGDSICPFTILALSGASRLRGESSGSDIPLK